MLCFLSAIVITDGTVKNVGVIGSFGHRTISSMQVISIKLQIGCQTKNNVQSVEKGVFPQSQVLFAYKDISPTRTSVYTTRVQHVREYTLVPPYGNWHKMFIPYSNISLWLLTQLITLFYLTGWLSVYHSLIPQLPLAVEENQQFDFWAGQHDLWSTTRITTCPPSILFMDACYLARSFKTIHYLTISYGWSWSHWHWAEVGYIMDRSPGVWTVERGQSTQRSKDRKALEVLTALQHELSYHNMISEMTPQIHLEQIKSF